MQTQAGLHQGMTDAPRELGSFDGGSLGRKKKELPVVACRGEALMNVKSIDETTLCMGSKVLSSH